MPAVQSRVTMSVTGKRKTYFRMGGLGVLPPRKCAFLRCNFMYCNAFLSGLMLYRMPVYYPSSFLSENCISTVQQKWDNSHLSCTMVLWKINPTEYLNTSNNQTYTKNQCEREYNIYSALCRTSTMKNRQRAEDLLTRAASWHQGNWSVSSRTLSRRAGPDCVSLLPWTKGYIPPKVEPQFWPMPK